mmetsp:Transcript_42564/g.120764  ORF Transcript_42564/g.120764 Transcript_42564/m.120764 type:complete len:837 (+) Transcript_42564:115-2625(+)
MQTTIETLLRLLACSSGALAVSSDIGLQKTAFLPASGLPLDRGRRSAAPSSRPHLAQLSRHYAASRPVEQPPSPPQSVATELPARLNGNNASALHHGRQAAVNHETQASAAAAAAAVVMDERPRVAVNGVEFDVLDREGNLTDGEAVTRRDDTVVLFLPGIFGYSGNSSQPQLASLSHRCPVWRLSIPPTDRSTFSELEGAVVTFIKQLKQQQPHKQVVLVGDSFGGLLALGVALRCATDPLLRPQRLLKGVLVVNPATSYLYTAWPLLGPIATALDGPLYTLMGSLALLSTVPDPIQRASIREAFWPSSVPITQRPRELVKQVQSTWAGFSRLADRIDPDTLRFRLEKWLLDGSERVSIKLQTKRDKYPYDLPTVIVAGSEDAMLPSEREAKRLAKLMPDSEQVLVAGSGHYVLDNRTNLTDILFTSKILNPPPSAEEKYFEKFVPPKLTEVTDLEMQQVNRIENATSPVWVSTNVYGRRIWGLSGVPTDRRVLFVGNHQLYGLDLGLLVRQIYKESGRLVRGMAHPIVFNGFGPGSTDPNRSTRTITTAPTQSPTQSQQPLQPQQQQSSRRFLPPLPPPPPLPALPLRNRRRNRRSDESGDESNGEGRESDIVMGMPPLERFGAVPVTGRNLVRLMQRQEWILLFPGGVREVFHRKGENDLVLWADTAEFVRTAAKYNYTIVPFSAIGASDSFQMLLDPEEMLRLPLGLGERIRRQADKMPTVREYEKMVPPLSVPKVPDRFYFLFHAPVDLTAVSPTDRDTCQSVYNDIRQRVETGIEHLREARQKDPFRNFVARTAFKRLYGRQPPSFELDELPSARSEEAKNNGSDGSEAN